MTLSRHNIKNELKRPGGEDNLRNEWAREGDPKIIEKAGTVDRGGLTLSYTAFLPENAKAALLIVHGISEHRGRYRRLQNDLARHGYAVYSYDQRGFGQSAGARTHVERYTELLLDLKEMLRFVREQHPDLKAVIIGHSFGGAVSGTFCIDYPTDADALVLSAPAYDVPSLPFRLHLLGYLLDHLIPGRPIRYPSEPIKLSRDPEVGVAFRNDPLVQSAGTPRFYVQFRMMNRYFHQNAEKIVLPTLILQGSEDRIVIPQGARALFEKLRSSRKKLIWYEGFYHEVFNEIGRERVISDLLAWLEESVL